MPCIRTKQNKKPDSSPGYQAGAGIFHTIPAEIKTFTDAAIRELEEKQ